MEGILTIFKKSREPIDKTKSQNNRGHCYLRLLEPGRVVDMLEGREAGEEGAQFDSLHEALAQPGHRQLPGLPHQLGDEAVVPLHRWEEVWGLVPTQAILE